MPTFEELQESYTANWKAMRVRPERRDAAVTIAKLIIAAKSKYAPIETKTNVPWWFIGLVHDRESDMDFGTYLGNGQRLGQRTTIEPKGRGPFSSFEAGAIDALEYDGLTGASDWSVERAAYRFEKFNGFGYRNKGVNSPYLYGGSTVYGPPEAKAGKYVADGVFDSRVVDKQLGTLTILKVLDELDDSLNFGGPQPQVVEADDELAHGLIWLQWALNKLGADPKLEEDGTLGPLTRGMVARFQKENGFDATGEPDGATMDEIDRHLAKLKQPAAATAQPKAVPPSPQPTPPMSFDAAVRNLFRSIFG